VHHSKRLTYPNLSCLRITSQSFLYFITLLGLDFTFAQSIYCFSVSNLTTGRMYTARNWVFGRDNVSYVMSYCVPPLRNSWVTINGNPIVGNTTKPSTRYLNIQTSCLWCFSILYMKYTIKNYNSQEYSQVSVFVYNIVTDSRVIPMDYIYSNNAKLCRKRGDGGRFQDRGVVEGKLKALRAERW